MRDASFVIWALLGTVLAGAVVAGRSRWASFDSLGTVLGALRARCVGRIALFLVWAWLGWHVFAR